VVFDGFDELDAVAPYEVLRNAAVGGAAWDVALVGAHGAGRVAGSHGLQLTVAEGVGHPDALIVPGGGWGEHAERGTWGEVRRGILPDRIAALAPGCRWASVCTGAMLLAAAGLTRGRPAVTHHVALSDLAATGTQVIEDARVVDDGDLLTAAGVTSGLDLALRIIEREMGTTLAGCVARQIEHKRSPAIWTRDHPVLPPGRDQSNVTG